MLNSTATQRTTRTALYARILALALLAAAFVLLPNTARADSTATYNVTGTLLFGDTFTGTMEFDQSGSTLQLINSTFTVGSTTFACNGATSNNCTVFDPFGLSFVNVPGQGSLLVLNWFDGSFNIFNPPSSFNFLGGYCLGCDGFLGVNLITNATATAAAPTPEPASFLLLGGGLLALALLSRRRLNSSYHIA